MLFLSFFFFHITQADIGPHLLQPIPVIPSSRATTTTTTTTTSTTTTTTTATTTTTTAAATKTTTTTTSPSFRTLFPPKNQHLPVSPPSKTKNTSNLQAEKEFSTTEIGLLTSLIFVLFVLLLGILWCLKRRFSYRLQITPNNNSNNNNNSRYRRPSSSLYTWNTEWQNSEQGAELEQSEEQDSETYQDNWQEDSTGFLTEDFNHDIYYLQPITTQQTTSTSSEDYEEIVW